MKKTKHCIIFNVSAIPWGQISFWFIFFFGAKTADIKSFHAVNP